MPRIEVLIQVVDDTGTRQARSSFQMGSRIFQMLSEDRLHSSPFHLVSDLGELFRDSLLRYPGLGSLVPEDMPITTSVGEPIRWTPSPAQQPVDLESIQREVERIRAAYPTQVPILPRIRAETRVNMGPIDYAELERRVLAGVSPEVSMGAHVVAEPRAEEDLDPVSSRVRPVVEEPPATSNLDQLNQGYQQGFVSRDTILRYMGLNNVASQEATQQVQYSPTGRIRGRTSQVMLDDSTFFGEELPSIQGDTYPGQDPPYSHQDMIRSFKEVYGGDQFMPKTPKKSQTPILSRYQRKPVI